MKSDRPIAASPCGATAENESSLEFITDSLCNFLRETVLAQNVEITPHTELSLVGVDSYSLMELILFVERRFGLILPAEELTPENTATLNALGHCCNQLLLKP